ncbi:hypothetical protein [Planococcus salinarum]|uniref:hypothetical protein n=1 Tax=Planococcus salinarum TaxID=622695 RepID=UPI000E3E610C|nr:hypothetical protein [Planococcus salinarum]TAA72716.1 hypothetical protein D2909_04900 [Planococcus salinarum]
MDIQLIIEQTLGFLEDLGVAGLLAAIFLEGSSIPFLGIIVVLAYGGILDMSLGGMGGLQP